MTKTFSFGPFKLDSALGMLMHGDQPTALGPRGAALLQRLVEHEGQPVGKDALIAAAWPSLVVEESNLTVQMATVRKVLSEAGGSRWIETLPRRGYRYAGPPVTVASVSKLADETPGLDKPSIAVLPFLDPDRSAESAISYADSVVEDIVNGLSRVRWLRVIAHSSTKKYRQAADVDARQIGRDLGVRYLLQGSVRMSSKRIRIGCQLVEADTGVQVWSERYDRPMTDLFELQDDVAIAVLGAIEPALRQTEATRVRRKRPDSLRAYELVLQTQADVFSGMPESSARALGLLERALALEPDYALAHSFAAMCHHNLFLRGGLDEVHREASIGHARAAMASGRDDALALTFAGFSMGMDAHDHTAALAAFEGALAVSPSSALTYILGSVVSGWSGRPDVAIAWAERGLRLSPFDAWAFAAWHSIALAHFKLGHFDAALGAATRAIQANPAHSVSYALFAGACVACGRLGDARKAAATALSLQPNFRYGQQLSGVNCEPGLAATLSWAFGAAGLPN